MKITRLKPKKNSLIDIPRMYANNNKACIFCGVCARSMNSNIL